MTFFENFVQINNGRDLREPPFFRVATPNLLKRYQLHLVFCEISTRSAIWLMNKSRFFEIGAIWCMKNSFFRLNQAEMTAFR